MQAIAPSAWPGVQTMVSHPSESDDDTGAVAATGSAWADPTDTAGVTEPV